MYVALCVLWVGDVFMFFFFVFFFFQAEDGIRDWSVTGVQTCALPIWQPVVSILSFCNWLAPRVGSAADCQRASASVAG